MTLIRILLIALVAWLLLRMIRNWADRQKIARQKSTSELESIVPCHHCGLHIPKNEALESDNKYYCSQEHLQLHRDDPG
ncbi:MAG: PP0621 family protein [Gammaproteobacteria bacterium]|nr:PP0621 family protein [Gammaproteobacteria bacterium]